MSQEEKSLLLKDLCARLPYNVKVKYKDHIVTLGGYNGLSFFIYDEMSVDIEEIKPYLRPMSSMTEEEEKEYRNIDNRSYSCPMDYAHIPASDRIDWLNKKMFDYRGLIKKNLALEAPDNIY